MKDYYQILGILETASQEDIRQAYLRMALVWHPDRHTGESPERIAIVTACVTILFWIVFRQLLDVYFPEPLILSLFGA